MDFKKILIQLGGFLNKLPDRLEAASHALTEYTERILKALFKALLYPVGLLYHLSGQLITAITTRLKSVDRYQIATKAGLAGTVVFGGLTIVGLTQHNAYLWTVTLWLCLWSMKLYHAARRKKIVWRSILLPRLSTLWIGAWLIYLLTK